MNINEIVQWITLGVWIFIAIVQIWNAVLMNDTLDAIRKIRERIEGKQ